MKLLQFPLCISLALCVFGDGKPFTNFGSVFHKNNRDQQKSISFFESKPLARSFGTLHNLRGNSFNQPQQHEDNGKKVDVDVFVKQALNSPLAVDPRIRAETDRSSPSAAAALAYVESISKKDSFCGLPTKAFLQTILNGGSRQEATAKATKLYIDAFNSGEKLPKVGPCYEAARAWREAFSSGEDPVLLSARAFMNAWPGVLEGNPCAVSGVDYVNAILSGKSHLEANKIAMIAFADAFKTLARKGRPLKDPACRDATRAFFNAIPQKPDPANAVALHAFMDKIFAEDAPAFDPVCLASLEGFIHSYSSGDDLLTANLKAARAFFREFARGSTLKADSPCAAAALTYAKQVRKVPSSPNAVAMFEYIFEAIRRGPRQFDPVCAAATEAYFDSYIKNRSEAEANEAAAVAYIDTLDKHPEFDVNSACGKAAQAYISEF